MATRTGRTCFSVFAKVTSSSPIAYSSWSVAPRANRRLLRDGARRSFSARTRLSIKKYSADHEWIELDSDGKIGTIGITEHASTSLGDVVFVELPEVGMEVSAGDSIGVVESVKSASEFLTPVTGKITEANKPLEDTPGTINGSPEEDGWLAKIEISNPGELDSLMSAEEYETLIKE